MHSIINEIAQAEQQADEIRVRAAADAREQIAKANEQAVEALTAFDNAEREKTREALSAAERDGEAEAARMRREMEAEANALCEEASTRIDAAKDYLLQKVQSIA